MLEVGGSDRPELSYRRAFGAWPSASGVVPETDSQLTTQSIRVVIFIVTGDGLGGGRHVVAAIPLEPPAWILLVNPAAAAPDAERLRGVHAEAVLARVMPLRSPPGVPTPCRWRCPTTSARSMTSRHSGRRCAGARGVRPRGGFRPRLVEEDALGAVLQQDATGTARCGVRETSLRTIPDTSPTCG